MNNDNSNIGNPIPGTYFHTTAQLSFIHSRIYRNIYSLEALRQPEADLLREIRDLDYLLDEWKESIPSIERPSLARNRGNNLPEVDIRTALFQVQYHHCMVMVHQASSRCTSWVQNQDTSEMGSSLAISVNASRSLLGKCLDSQLDLRSYNML